MAENKHTPGPWSHKRAGFAVDDEFDFGISAVIDGRPHCIAEAFGRVSNDIRVSLGSLDVQANARLIAAAPDLLDGCNALLGFLQLIASRDDMPSDVVAQINPREGGSISHRIVEARAAIAKATGAPE